MEINSKPIAPKTLKCLINEGVVEPCRYTLKKIHKSMSLCMCVYDFTPVNGVVPFTVTWRNRTFITKYYPGCFYPFIHEVIN